MKKLMFTCASLALLWGCQGGAEKQTATTTTTTVKQAPLPTNQQVFSLSMISNLPAAIAWPYDKTLKDNAVAYADSIIVHIAPLMDGTLQNATDTNGQNFSLKNWTRVWGPAVITDNNCDLCTGIPDLGSYAYVPVSSMTIFVDNNNNYVVGIEATNEESKTDWLTLDVNVFSTVPFNTAVVSQGNLTLGTSIGLNQYLLNLKDMNTQLTADSFLHAKLSTANSITVTGHSLGGALSPVYALHLKQYLNYNNVYCLSTAGASPGDMAFVSYFNSQMGSNATRIWNTLDVVPHAWEVDTMNRIKNIYQAKSASISFDPPYACDGKTKPPVPFDSMSTPQDICDLVTELTNKLTNDKLVYGSICGGGQTFTGTGQANALYFNTTVPDHSTIWDDMFKGDITFLTQLGNQHVAAYSIYFKIVGIHQYMRTQLESGTITHALDQWKCNGECRCRLVSTAKKPATTQEKAAALWGAIQKQAWNW